MSCRKKKQDCWLNCSSTQPDSNTLANMGPFHMWFHLKHIEPLKTLHLQILLYKARIATVVVDVYGVPGQGSPRAGQGIPAQRLLLMF